MCLTNLRFYLQFKDDISYSRNYWNLFLIKDTLPEIHFSN